MNFRSIITFIFTIYLSLHSIVIASPDFKDTPLVTIIHIERHSNLDTNDFYFRIKLSNNQHHDVKVNLQDLLDNKLKLNTELRILEETFISDHPEFSVFKYETLDHSLTFQGNGYSILSHWIPDPDKHPLIEVKSITYVRFGMSNFRYDILFSDNSVLSIGYLGYPHGLFNIGDIFFKIRDNQKLVNFSSGRVVEKGSYSNMIFIPISW